jgi:hypothetical protein
VPIIILRNKVIHYAHIPKCAGNSIIKHINDLRIAKQGFADKKYFSHPPKTYWNITSPQHIDGESLARLFPKPFFTDFITIVRNPLNRLKSAFHFQNYFEGKIDKNISLNSFVKEVLPIKFKTLGWLDNHFLPQNSFLYPEVKYRIFKLEEDGVNQMTKHIDDLAIWHHFLRLPFFNWKRNSPQYHKNKSSYDMVGDKYFLDDESLALVRKLYKMDYELFAYK